MLKPHHRFSQALGDVSLSTSENHSEFLIGFQSVTQRPVWVKHNNIQSVSQRFPNQDERKEALPCTGFAIDDRMASQDVEREVDPLPRYFVSDDRIYNMPEQSTFGLRKAYLF